MFISGSLALDFLNTLATRVDEQVYWIDDGLLAWLAEAQLVPAKVLKEREGQTMPGELDGRAAQPRNLHECCRRFVRRGAVRRFGRTTRINWTRESPARPRRTIRSEGGRGRRRDLPSSVEDDAAMVFPRFSALADPCGNLPNSSATKILNM